MQDANVLTVSQVVDVYNVGFDAIGSLTVEGEVSDFRVVHGKWVTFSLKDEESTLPCFMPVWSLKTPLEDGMLVRMLGKGRLRNKGFFSFTVEAVRPAGEGSLKRAFELLKGKLEEEGLFSRERKRALPRFPQHVAFITSREAAAYSDFLKVLAGRQGGLTISFIHTQVQGEEAPRQIVEALEVANTELSELDAIVLVRGGGSLEDLHAFNDEVVVRAVAGSRTPTIVGIGHERDVSLAELAADVRASTPSNAAELLAVSREEVAGEIEGIKMRLRGSMREELQRQQLLVQRGAHTLANGVRTSLQQVQGYVHSLQTVRGRIRQEIGLYSERIKEKERVALGFWKREVAGAREEVAQLQRVLRSMSPDAVLKRGFSITRSADGKIIKSVADVSAGEVLVNSVQDGKIVAEVEKVTKG